MPSVLTKYTLKECYWVTVRNSPHWLH